MRSLCKRHLEGGSIVYFRIEISQHLAAAGLNRNLKGKPCRGGGGATGDSDPQMLVKVSVGL